MISTILRAFLGKPEPAIDECRERLDRHEQRLTELEEAMRRFAEHD